jgi:hypothetical protein
MKTSWNNLIQHCLGKGGQIYDDSACIVTLRSSKIIIGYRSENVLYEYTGVNTEDVHEEGFWKIDLNGEKIINEDEL